MKTKASTSGSAVAMATNAQRSTSNAQLPIRKLDVERWTLNVGRCDPGFTLVELPKAVSKGFTLVELLVVVGVIVILVAILVPSLESAMAASRRSKCATNLSAIGKALMTYVNDSPSNLYPKTTNHYMAFGQLGTAPGYDDPNSHDVDNRPLNKYLGFTGKGTEVKVAQCPSDIGGQAVLDPGKNNNFTDDGTANSSSNVFLSTGNSYVDAYGVVLAGRTIRTGVAFMWGNEPNTPHMAKPAASKILVGDAPFPGENKYGDYGTVVGDRRNRWHASDKRQRQFNLLFADSHVEFFSFGDPAKSGPDNIENIDGNGTPISSTAAVKPQRGFW